MPNQIIPAGIQTLSGVLAEVYKDLKPHVLEQYGKAANAFHRQYAQNYLDRHGIIKVFCVGMRKPVSLEDVYVAVHLFEQDRTHRYLSLDDVETAYRQSGTRRFQLESADRRYGIEVANDEQYLMVLGGPGAGKSTLLRKIGLEALKGKEGAFEHMCIPVFIELKHFTDGQISLEDKITEEFRICGYPCPETMMQDTLKAGKLLVLLDGLDEVPTQNTNAVIREIKDFVDRYGKNRFITSCRVAAYKGGLDRFRDVYVADFDDDQIKNYIENWFASDANPQRVAYDRKVETALRCWDALDAPEHKATKELAQNPLLLTLLCLVYDTSQDFPRNRAFLYQEALNVLLKEWAAEKRIQRDPIYTDLNAPLEVNMLSEMAYQGFEIDRLFYPESEIVNRIKAFFRDNLNAPEHLDGEQVLQAIAVQQGLLVERVRNVYSFSHLTLQEYLTAQYMESLRLSIRTG